MQDVLQFRFEWILPQMGLLWGLLDGKFIKGGEESLETFCTLLQDKIRVEAQHSRTYADLFSQGREAQVELINNPEAFQRLMDSHTFALPANKGEPKNQEARALTQTIDRNIREQELILLLVQGYVVRNWEQVAKIALELILLYKDVLQSSLKYAFDYQEQASIKENLEDWDGCSKKLSTVEHHNKSAFIVSRLLVQLTKIHTFAQDYSE